MARLQFHLTDTVAVAIGGALGAVARVSLTGGVDGSVTAEPPLSVLLTTLAINTVGALVLALLRRPHSLHPPGWLRVGLSVGFLGAFTTWSAVMAAVWILGSTGGLFLSLGYLFATVVLGLTAAWWGLRSEPRGSLR